MDIFNPQNDPYRAFRNKRLESKEKAKESRLLAEKREKEEKFKAEREARERAEKENILKDNNLKDKVVRFHYFKKEKGSDDMDKEGKFSKGKIFSDDQEITIKIKPKKIIRIASIILILVLVFYLGRFSADGSADEPSNESSSDFNWSFLERLGQSFSSSAGSDSGKNTNSSVSSDSGDSGSSEDSNDAGDETPTEADTTSAVVAGSTASANGTTTTDGDESNATAEDEDLVTTYDDVTLSLDAIEHEWKGTWGKITTMTFTLKNKENGPIKMDHFGMSVEGYGDFEKTLSISQSVQRVESMTQLSSKIGVPSGFAYNALAAGDLSNVMVTIVLYNANGQTIGTASKEFSLGG